MPDSNKNKPLSEKGRVISLNTMVEGDVFRWNLDVWHPDFRFELEEARAVILPRTVRKEFYFFCRRFCPNVFPDYDLRFRWEGKIGAALLFTSLGVPHPRTMIFPRLGTLVDEHPHMGHQPPPLPAYPYLIKASCGGEGNYVWVIDSKAALEACFQRLRQLELQREFGFVVQEYIPGVDRDLRVVVIGDQVLSYWRVQPEGFLHNISRGGTVDRDSFPGLQKRGREEVRRLCRKTGFNLAAFDLIFPKGSNAPIFIEVNYTFGWAGLGGIEDYSALLNQAVAKWLADRKDQVKGRL
ncbi:MAG: ATP-grasp domain-containing protein [Thermodesulfobacteriota bacterium]